VAIGPIRAQSTEQPQDPQVSNRSAWKPWQEGCAVMSRQCLLLKAALHRAMSKYLYGSTIELTQVG